MSDSKKLSDFNDLYLTEGLPIVKKQLQAALESLNKNDSETPTETTTETPANALPFSGRMTLNYALQRFALAMPGGKVWDSEDKKLLKKVAVKDWWGAKLFKQWLDHEKRSQVDEDHVLAIAAAAQDGGRGVLGAAIGRYIYLYPTDSVFDIPRREIIPISSLKIAIADVYDQWVKHPRRREINRDDLVFDPGGPWESQEGRINTYRGLPLRATGSLDECKHIRHLLYLICNKDETIYCWLKKWLAYPLQNIGAKMATAVIMHSDIQGTGKSLFFDEVMNRIYGEYGTTLGQNQLEGNYTEWRSQKLYLLFEEILSRDQKYSHTGTVKHMITGRTQRIEKKFVSGWEEANHANAVFLSNEYQPWPIEPTDRRMLICWPEQKLPEDVKLGVLKEINARGVQAFFRWLVEDVDVSDFNTHLEPPMTEAKQKLIDFGRSGWELFYRDWKEGLLAVPFANCLVEDVYKVYKHWCSQTSEKHLSREKFSYFLSFKVKRRRDVRYRSHAINGIDQFAKGVFFIVNENNDDVDQQIWLGQCVYQFKKAMDKTDEE